MSSGRAYIGIGLPGSGKTTHLKQFAAKIGAVYICADDIRAEWYGDSGVQQNPGEIWDEVRCRARKALMTNQHVVIDGTNLKPQDRQLMIQACGSAARIEAIWCQAPFGVCLDRNRRRERVVPHHAMKRMRNQLYRTPPSIQEGFDRIQRIHTAG